MSIAQDWALFFDLYHPNMGDVYWRMGRQDEKAVFNLFYRRNPFGNGFTVVAGLAKVVEYLHNLHFRGEDIDYLRSLGIYADGFLEYLREFRFTGDIDAMPEGSIAFPNEPLIRVKAPIIQALLLEVFLANSTYQTLVATKAARVVRAAQGRAVAEFGARRAQDVDAANWGARAAVLAGCVGTSNVLAAKMFGMKPVGTHAHLWVMSFPKEIDAFRAWADAHPEGALFLVDTYDTLRSGLPNAIQVAKELTARGGKFLGIRLDSGRIPYLSGEARRMLDEAGFKDAVIMASSDLDEQKIQAMLAEGAKVDSFGVGTAIIAGKGDPALGAVYKMVAREENGQLVPTIKISDDPEKEMTPGDNKVVRVYAKETGKAAGDVILPFTDSLPVEGEAMTLQDPVYPTRSKTVRNFLTRELLVPVFRGGKLVYQVPTLGQAQAFYKQEIDSIWDTYKQLDDPETYPVNPTKELMQRKSELIGAIKQRTQK